VEVVDQEGERGGVDPDEAARDLSLASNLDRGDESNQQGDQPDADGATRCAATG